MIDKAHTPTFTQNLKNGYGTGIGQALGIVTVYGVGLLVLALIAGPSVVRAAAPAPVQNALPNSGAQACGVSYSASRVA